MQTPTANSRPIPSYLVALVLAMTSVACMSVDPAPVEAVSPRSEEVQPGNALGELNGFGYTLTRIPPGQEFIFVFMLLENVSDQELTIRTIESGETKGSAAAVIDVRLAPRDVKSPASVSSGRHMLYPPAQYRNWGTGSGCVVQRLVSPARFVLEPGDAARMALRIRTLSVGSWRLGESTVVYEQGANVFEERLPLVMKLKVREQAPPQVLDRSQRRCLDHAEPLPGVSTR